MNRRKEKVETWKYYHDPKTAKPKTYKTNRKDDIYP